MKSYYDVLEVEPTATAAEVYQGYVRVKNAYSQDSPALYSIMDQNECKMLLNTIEEAYAVLSDPEKRILYDEAKGFRKPPAQGGSRPMPTAASLASLITEQAQQFNRPDENTTGDGNIGKLVARRIYDLNYERDENFEQEIEKTTVFSGPLLKKIREYKGVEIHRMVDITKVSRTHLQYIESENLENMPAPVYVRGFVFQYAKVLRLNPDLVATSYMNRINSLKEEQGKKKR